MKNNYIGEIKADDLFIAADGMDKADELKEFNIPVEWSVKSKYPVKARNLKEAFEWVKDNADLIKLNPDTEYIEGTFKPYDIDSFVDEDEYLEYIQQLYEIVGYPEDYNSYDAYNDYCSEWYEEYGYDNGECTTTYAEFMEDEFLDYINGDLL